MPLVAMTREMGSLGKDVAAAVSAHLGKPLVNHEIIGQLANKMRLRKSHVIRFLEGKASIWERLSTDKTSLSIYTAEETLGLVESGQVAVIRGWGSAHLLRPISHVVCVRVCAPLKVRIERMKERLNSDDEELITEEIRLSEEAHSAITRRHFGIDWRDGEQYDLVLNTERVSIEECANEIIALVKDPQFQETEKSRQLLANLALEAHVRAALRTDERTAKMRVTITADKGGITLTGMIEPGLNEAHAVEVISNVPGVTNLRSELRPLTFPRKMLDS